VNALPLVSATASQSTAERKVKSAESFLFSVPTLALFFYESFFKPSGSGATRKKGKTFVDISGLASDKSYFQA